MDLEENNVRLTPNIASASPTILRKRGYEQQNGVEGNVICYFAQTVFLHKFFLGGGGTVECIIHIILGMLGGFKNLWIK